MKPPRVLDIDWLGLVRAFERFDPSWEDEPLPYLNVRMGSVAYFGADKGVDWEDTLDLDRHLALTLSDQAQRERHARMRAFAATAPPDLSSRLREALGQQRKVAGFYAILEENEAALVRWQRVEGPRVRELVSDWLAGESIVAQNLPPWS